MFEVSKWKDVGDDGDIDDDDDDHDGDDDDQTTMTTAWRQRLGADDDNALHRTRFRT